jgi:hypothetical protein
MLNFSKLISPTFFLVSSSGIQLFKQFFIAKYLDPNLFSILGISNLIAMLFNNFGTLGGYWFATNKISQSVQRKNLRLISVIQDALFSSYVYLAPISLGCIYLVLGIDSNFLEYTLYGLAFVVFLIVNIPISQFNSLEYSRRQLIKAVVSITIIFPLLFLQVNFVHILIIESLMLLIFSFKIKRLKLVSVSYIYKAILINRKILFLYSISIALTTIIASFGRLTATKILDFNELGIYFFAFIIVGIGDQIQYLVAVLLQPVISEMEYKVKNGTTPYFILRIWAIVLLICSIISLIIYFIFPYVLSFIPKYSGVEYLLIPALILMIARASNVWPLYYTITGAPDIVNRVQIMTISLLIIGAIISYFIFNSQEIMMASSILIIEALALFLAPIFIIRKIF